MKKRVFSLLRLLMSSLLNKKTRSKSKRSFSFMIRREFLLILQFELLKEDESQKGLPFDLRFSRLGGQGEQRGQDLRLNDAISPVQGSYFVFLPNELHLHLLDILDT